MRRSENCFTDPIWCFTHFGRPTFSPWQNSGIVKPGGESQTTPVSTASPWMANISAVVLNLTFNGLYRVTGDQVDYCVFSNSHIDKRCAKRSGQQHCQYSLYRTPERMGNLVNRVQMDTESATNLVIDFC